MISSLMGNTVTIVCVTKYSLHAFCRPRTILKVEMFMVLGTWRLKIPLDIRAGIDSATVDCRQACLTVDSDKTIFVRKL